MSVSPVSLPEPAEVRSGDPGTEGPSAPQGRCEQESTLRAPLASIPPFRPVSGQSEAAAWGSCTTPDLGDGPALLFHLARPARPDPAPGPHKESAAWARPRGPRGSGPGGLWTGDHKAPSRCFRHLASGPRSIRREGRRPPSALSAGRGSGGRRECPAAGHGFPRSYSPQWPEELLAEEDQLHSVCPCLPRRRRCRWRGREPGQPSCPSQASGRLPF